MFNKLKDIFHSFFPDYQDYLKLGYKAGTFNNEFVLKKEYPHLTVRVHQAIEPYNPRYGNLDFSFEGCCLVVEVKEESESLTKLFDRLRDRFEFYHMVGKFHFFFDKKMELTAPKLLECLSTIDQPTIQ